MISIDKITCPIINAPVDELRWRGRLAKSRALLAVRPEWGRALKRQIITRLKWIQSEGALLEV